MAGLKSGRLRGGKPLLTKDAGFNAGRVESTEEKKRGNLKTKPFSPDKEKKEGGSS